MATRRRMGPQMEALSVEKSSGLEFLPSLPTPKARSAFAALSGHGDNFTTIDDLCTSTREGVFLESAIIPHLEIYPDEKKTPLNAYLYDFYMHSAWIRWSKPMVLGNLM